MRCSLIRVFFVLFFISTAFVRPLATADLITELKKLEGVENFEDPKYLNFVYKRIQGSAPVSSIYHTSKEYKLEGVSNIMCGFFINMYLFGALYPESKNIDLKFMGAFDVFEINDSDFRSMYKSGFTKTYNDNRDRIKNCLQAMLHVGEAGPYDGSLYDIKNAKNTEIELMFLLGLQSASLKIADLKPRSYYRYNTAAVPEIFKKKLSDSIRRILLVVKNRTVEYMSKGGKWEAAVYCQTLTHIGDADINKSYNLRHVECVPRIVRNECTDSTYLINSTIVQASSLNNYLELIKVYQIEAYHEKGEKLKISKPINIPETLKEDWDYHQASILVLEDKKTKETYITVIDNLLSHLPLTVHEWMSFFQNRSSIRFTVFPYIRVEKREERYMTLDAAKKEAEKKTIRPAYNPYR